MPRDTIHEVCIAVVNFAPDQVITKGIWVREDLVSLFPASQLFELITHLTRGNTVPFFRSWVETGIPEAKGNKNFLLCQFIDRLEKEGRSRRRNPNLTPDIHSISQVLRVVGALVDHKNGKLLTVTKDDEKVTFEYELVSGKKVLEELGVPALYDLWVRLYRRQRS